MACVNDSISSYSSIFNYIIIICKSTLLWIQTFYFNVSIKMNGVFMVWRLSSGVDLLVLTSSPKFFLFILCNKCS